MSTDIRGITRKRLVYGTGPKDADIMIIGEAPGQDEERQGKPFVGRSGQLLEELLNRAGILRSECYITNVVKERPPKNNIKKFIDISKKHHKVSDEYYKYAMFLIDEINEVNPNVIIATGNIPLFTLTKQKGITKWRGSVLESSTGHKVIPVLHPASALRQYTNRHFISFDLKKAKRESEYPDIRLKQRHYIVDPTLLQTIDFLQECKRHDMVAFDIEVSYKEVSCISFAYNSETAISIPFTKGGREYFTVEHEYIVWKMIGELLEDESIRKVGQNVTFDSTFLFRKYGIKSKNLHDTMIMLGILYPDFPKDLGFITSIYSDLPYYKDERKSIDMIIPNEEAYWVYNAKDSIVLMDAFPRLMEELERMSLAEAYERQRRLIQPLLYMTELGIRMDTSGMREMAGEVQEKLDKIEKKMNELVGYEINPRSWKQLQDYFYGDKDQGGLGIKPYMKNGKPTTDEGALIRLARGTSTRRPLEEARLLLDHRGLQKLKGTYLDMSLDEDGRVRTSMNPIGTYTGRLSSSKTIFGTGANLQNQPPIMRSFMLTDPDHIAYELDLGQAENRIVAYIAPEPKMIEAFETGADIHSRTASYIFGIPEDEIADMNKEDVKCESIGTGDYTHRFWGKKANHAFNYGQGYKKFAYQVEIPEDEGQMIHSKYHSAYPGVRKYHNWVKEMLNKSRSVENLFGRKCMFLDRWSHQMFESAYAFIPQSTVGEIINNRGLNFIYDNPEIFEPVKLLNQIHDSLLKEIHKKYPLEIHAECLLAIAKNLEYPLSFRGREFSIPCDLKILPKNLKDGSEISNVTNYTIEELTNLIKKETSDA